MTAIELMIVLGIFTAISSVATVNYGQFRAKVNVKNLANEVALTIVEAQKSSTSGKVNTGFCASCKPSYGVVFNTSTPTQFVYYADLDNSNSCNSAGCNPPSYSVGGEVLKIITITGGSTLGTIVPTGSGCPGTLSSLTLTFRRPDTAPLPTHACNPSDVLINLSSSQSFTGRVRVYSSGRIQMN